MAEEKPIHMAIILEVMGRPPEHLIASLEELIKGLSQEKDIKVLDKKIHPPKELEKQKGFYTTFAEVELKVETFTSLIVVSMKYMPAHIEIISPEKVTVSNNLLSEYFSELQKRIHTYDEVVRLLQNEKAILEKKLKDVLEKKSDEK